MELRLAKARVVAEATVVRHRQTSAPAAGRTGPERQPAVVVVTQFEHGPAYVVVRVRHQDIDRSVQGIRAIQCIARSTDNFDGVRHFAGQFKQLVDVAEAAGSGRDSVLENQECTAGARTGQDRRADRGQVLLATAARHPGTGHFQHQLVNVRMPGCLNIRRIDASRVAGLQQSAGRFALCRYDDFLEFGRLQAGREQAQQ